MLVSPHAVAAPVTGRCWVVRCCRNPLRLLLSRAGAQEPVCFRRARSFARRTCASISARRSRSSGDSGAGAWSSGLSTGRRPHHSGVIDCGRPDDFSVGSATSSTVSLLPVPRRAHPGIQGEGVVTGLGRQSFQRLPCRAHETDGGLCGHLHRVGHAYGSPSAPRATASTRRARRSGDPAPLAGCSAVHFDRAAARHVDRPATQRGHEQCARTASRWSTSASPGAVLTVAR